MTTQDSAGTSSVFGSRVRTQILGYLAQAPTPRTGYSIAKRLRIGVSNVYPELKRLEAWAIVESRPDANGSKLFELTDEDLRRFLLRRFRVISSEDWFSPASVARREAQSIQAKALPVRVPRIRLSRRKRSFEEEFRRPPEKDRALKRIRARPGGTA